jgi:hypothetical protein
MFSGSSYPMKLTEMLCDYTGSGKSNMAAAKTEVLICWPCLWSNPSKSPMQTRLACQVQPPENNVKHGLTYQHYQHVEMQNKVWWKVFWKLFIYSAWTLPTYQWFHVLVCIGWSFTISNYSSAFSSLFSFILVFNPLVFKTERKKYKIRIQLVNQT